MSTATPHDIRDRLMLVIQAVTSEGRRFKELEERTRVPSATWRSFWNRPGALPSGAMIEEVGREWPQYAFWVVSGFADWEAGHVAPPTATYLPESHRSESSAATAYLSFCVGTDNPRPSRPIFDGLKKLSLEKQALDMLGGYAAVAELRHELEERGVLQPSERDRMKLSDLKMSDLLQRPHDPIIDRAVEAVERAQVEQKQAERNVLKQARDNDWLMRKGED